MEVIPERGDFSTQTGQGPWSQDRVGNNHCMCLGAWALYKAKGKGDGDELQCDSIPDYSSVLNILLNGILGIITRYLIKSKMVLIVWFNNVITKK